jgi:uncharacterized membrane protein YphA (DoxX/SURF4 family)
MNVVVGLVRIALGLTLLAAGVSKARDRTNFLETLEGFDIVPGLLRSPASWLIPTVEIAVGSLLVVGVAHKLTAAVSLIMIAVFSVGLLIQMARGRLADCGCFGSVFTHTTGTIALLRNAVLVGGACLVYFSGPGALSLTSFWVR